MRTKTERTIQEDCGRKQEENTVICKNTDWMFVSKGDSEAMCIGDGSMNYEYLSAVTNEDNNIIDNTE